MKYQTKAQAISAAQAAGSSATTWSGGKRWLLSHVTPAPLFATARRRWDRGETRKQYARRAWIARMERRIDVAAQKLGKWSMADAIELSDFLTRPYLARAEQALTSAWPYRQSDSKWAGGDHSVTVRLATPSAQCSTSRAWSDNGKWSGTNSHAIITTDIPTLLTFPTLMTRDGLALCHVEQIGQREYSAKWIEQSVGVGLKTVEGYLIRGYHVRAPGIASARKKAAQARTQAVAATIRERQSAITKRAGLAALKSVWISVDDSIAAGNCQSSTGQFARRMWDAIGASGPCAVRADIVIATRDDYYTRRALGAALGHLVSHAA